MPRGQTLLSGSIILPSVHISCRRWDFCGFLFVLISSVGLQRRDAFVGMVKYYFRMFDRRSHMLQPLTRLTPKKVNSKWTEVEQKVFDKVK